MEAEIKAQIPGVDQIISEYSAVCLLYDYHRDECTSWVDENCVPLADPTA